MNKFISTRMSAKTLLSCFCLLIVAMTTTHCLPLSSQETQHTQTREQTGGKTRTDWLQVAGFRSFGDVSSFIRAWFRRFQSKAHASSTDHVTQTREKRDTSFSGVQLDISNNSTAEAAFEEYEKEYLIQQTMAGLKTLYYHKEYLDFIKSKKMDKEHKKPSDKLGGTTASPKVDTNASNVPDYNRVDPILEAKLNELRSLDNVALNRIFRDVRRAVEDGIGDNSIASLCCQMTG